MFGLCPCVVADLVHLHVLWQVLPGDLVKLIQQHIYLDGP